MKYASLVVLALIVLSFGSVGTVLGADDPFLVNYSAWTLDYPVSGSQSITLIVTNTSGTTQDIVVSSWWDFYEYSDPSYSWIDPSWCTRINPSTQTLLPGETMVSNVEFTLPSNAPDAKWITWIKVSGGGLDKPVVVALRKGTAIPMYDYAISPGDYLLEVTGYGASAMVSDPIDTKAPPITVKNKSNTTGLFMALLTDCPQQTGSPKGITKISPDSALQHTPDEVGLELTNITAEEAGDWISFSATADAPLEVGPKLSKMINWSLNIPDSLPNGNYLMLVKIKPASSPGFGEGETGVNINLGTFIRLKVDRHETDTGLGIWPIALAGGLVALALGYFGFCWVVRTIKRVKPSNGNRRYSQE